MSDANDLFEGIENKRSQCLIILVLDTSGSMAGQKIASVNKAVEEALDEIQDFSDKNPHSEIQIAVLDFATNARWIVNQPLSPGDLKQQWVPLDADGGTYLGLALTELNNKLRRKSHGGWIDESRGVCPPGIIFLTDGMPNDYWEGPMEKLKNNGWYKAAFKYCLAAGDDLSVGMDVFKELVQSKDGKEGIHLISDANLSKLADYIKLTTLAVSKISSSVIPSTAPADGSATPVQVAPSEQREQIGDELDEIDDMVV